MTTTKRSTVYAVERTDWSGETEEVAHFDTRAEAEVKATELRRSSRAVDRRADRVRYTVVEYEWIREG